MRKQILECVEGLLTNFTCKMRADYYDFLFPNE